MTTQRKLLLGILVLLLAFNTLRAWRRSRERARNLAPITAQLSRAWTAFDRAADARNAPDPTFRPLSDELRAQEAAIPKPASVDLTPGDATRLTSQLHQLARCTDELLLSRRYNSISQGPLSLDHLVDTCRRTHTTP